MDVVQNILLMIMRGGFVLSIVGAIVFAVKYRALNAYSRSSSREDIDRRREEVMSQGVSAWADFAQKALGISLISYFFVAVFFGSSG